MLTFETQRRFTCDLALATREEPHNPLTHYVIVRRDIPRGVQAAQITHAAGESSPGKLPSGTYAVVLTVPDEAALRELDASLDTRSIRHHTIYENASAYGGQAMAIGVVPAPRSVLRRHFSSLPLLR